MPFQKTINTNPPLAVEGNFASSSYNYHAVLAGTQALTAGPAGVTMARFAWANPTTGKVANAKTEGHILGFVRRGDNTALITGWLDEASMVIPAGYGVTMYDNGDFWVKTTTSATIGQKIFANDTTGAIATGDAGGTVAGSTETDFKVASVGAANTLIKMTKVY